VHVPGPVPQQQLRVQLQGVPRLLRLLGVGGRRVPVRCVLVTPPSTHLEFHDYLAGVTTGRPPGWRAGQWYFNALADVRPDLAERVRGTALDPFHRDDLLPAFLRYVARHWNEP
jgi:hypothetical protein